VAAATGCETRAAHNAGPVAAQARRLICWLQMTLQSLGQGRRGRYGERKCEVGGGNRGPNLWAVIVILFAFWLAGPVLHFAGGLIHLLLLVALVLIIVNVLTGRGARV
jgi:Family of unknown function (DUF5670)